MTAHNIATETKWVSVALLGRVEQYRLACSCGVDSPWCTAEMAEGYAARHRYEVAG